MVESEKKVEKQKVIWKPTDEQKLNNHIPDAVWKLSKTCDVFIEDDVTGQLIQILDLRGKDNEESWREFRTIALPQ